MLYGRSQRAHEVCVHIRDYSCSVFGCNDECVQFYLVLIALPLPISINYLAKAYGCGLVTDLSITKCSR